MVKRKKIAPTGASNAYLISFGDTMTALLAFFIVLNSLAYEQTGANLYSGTGSFVVSLRAIGLPGQFTKRASQNPFQKEQAGPLYIVADRDSTPSADSGSGPDDDPNKLRVVDREKDMLRRFLIEMDGLVEVKSLPKSTGQIVFDFFEPLKQDSPMVDQNATDVFRQAMVRAGHSGFRIDIIVWAATPGISSWRRATTQARELREDLLNRLSVPEGLRDSVTATGKPWFFSDEKRPRYSFGVWKLANPN